jgi:hypothetical protein
VDDDLTRRQGPVGPVLERLDELLQEPIRLSEPEIGALVDFVGEGLLDPRALAQDLCALVPDEVPSGLPVAEFQGCGPARRAGPADAGAIAALGDGAGAARGLRLAPNPTVTGTSVSFTLARESPVEIRVYDAGGRLVRGVMSGALQPGEHSIDWDGRDDAGRELAAGVYFLRVTRPEGDSTRRVAMLR